jgi:hypothetical protein
MISKEVQPPDPVPKAKQANLESRRAETLTKSEAKYSRECFPTFPESLLSKSPERRLCPQLAAAAPTSRDMLTSSTQETRCL